MRKISRSPLAVKCLPLLPRKFPIPFSPFGDGAAPFSDGKVARSPRIPPSKCPLTFPEAEKAAATTPSPARNVSGVVLVKAVRVASARAFSVT